MNICSMSHGRTRQRGAATLMVSLVLMFAMTLAAYFLNRNMALEQRLAANQVQAAQAFEAAEAGLEWATAQLNNPAKLGSDCQPSTDASAQSFRARYLSVDVNTGAYTPRTWTQAGLPLPMQAMCVRNTSQAQGWDCSCPAGGHPLVAMGAATSSTNSDGAPPAFVVTLLPVSTPGQLRVIAQGCTSHAGACQPGIGVNVNVQAKADATAQVQQMLALVSGLASPPTAPLTVVGNVSTSAALGLHRANTTSAGAAVQAGGNVLAANARIGTTAGGITSTAVIEQDTSLSNLSEARFFSQLFGADPATWRAQSVVQKMDCKTDCNAAVLDALAATDGALLLWAEGDLRLSGPLSLGSAARPVVLIVGGIASLIGGVQIHGLLHASKVEWSADSTGAGRVTGAVTSSSHYGGNNAADLIFDAAVLQTLTTTSGSFARVAGSWKDF